jgi:hypothetical protein
VSDTGYKNPTYGFDSNSNPPYDDNGWNNEIYIYSSDDQHASITAPTFDTNDYSWVLVASGFDFSEIGDTDIIDGIEVGVERKAGDDNSVQDAYIDLWIDDACLEEAPVTGSPWGVLETYDEYTTAGGPTEDWGASLTGADVKDSSFGVCYAVKAIADDAQVYVDHIKVKIYYHSAAPPASDTRPARTEGYGISSSTRVARAEGNTTLSDTRAARIEGGETLSSTRAARVEGNELDSDTRAARTEGCDTDTNTRAARVEGYDTDTSTRAARTEGNETASNTRAARIAGLDIVSSTRDARIIGGVVNTRAARIEGFRRQRGEDVLYSEVRNLVRWMSKDVEGLKITDNLLAHYIIDGQRLITRKLKLPEFYQEMDMTYTASATSVALPATVGWFFAVEIDDDGDRTPVPVLYSDDKVRQANQGENYYCYLVGRNLYVRAGGVPPGSALSLKLYGTAIIAQPVSENWSWSDELGVTTNTIPDHFRELLIQYLMWKLRIATASRAEHFELGRMWRSEFFANIQAYMAERSGIGEHDTIYTTFPKDVLT